MATFKAEVRERLLDLAWRHWTECGVSGWQTGAATTAIDIEALILFTAEIGDLDPRLRDEALDWCAASGTLVSKVRLKNVHKLGLGRRAFEEFAATVNAHSDLAWPSGDAHERRFKRTRRSELDLRRPSVVQLRSRAIFGVSARAEILTLLAVDRGTYTGTRLSERIFFGRRMTVESAELLVRAGLLGSNDVSAPRTYALERPQEVRTLLGPLPSAMPSWPHVFRVLATIHQIAETVSDQSQVVRAVEAQKLLVEVDRDTVRGGLQHIPSMDGNAASWTRFTDWALGTIDRARS